MILADLLLAEVSKIQGDMEEYNMRMGWSKRGATQMAKLRAYYLNGGDMLELARYQEEELPMAALDGVTRITLMFRKQQELFPCLSDEGRVWAEPSIAKKLNV